MCHLRFTYNFQIIFIIFLSVGNSWSYAAKNCQKSFSLLNSNKLLERHNEIKNKYRQDQLIDDVLTPVFIAGQERVSDILKIGQKLQTENIDPRKTHIGELPQLHWEYVNKVAQVVAVNPIRTYEYFLTEFNSFRRELEQVIHSSGATYEWAIYFGFRLSLFVDNLLEGRIVDRRKKRRSHQKDAIRLTQKIMQVFPSKVFIPVPYNIGIIFLNRTFPSNKHPMQLSEQRVWSEHGHMKPYPLYAHDGHHGLSKEVYFLDSAFNIYYDQNFHRFFVESIENLAIRDRKMAEWTYYSKQHETKDFFWYRRAKPRNINGNQIERHIEDVRPFLSNTTEVRENPQETALAFIFQSADVFERIAQEYLSTQGEQ